MSDLAIINRSVGARGDWGLSPPSQIKLVNQQSIVYRFVPAKAFLANLAL